MDLQRLAERNEDFEEEEKSKLELQFFTDAETDAIHEALRFVSAACLHSKHSIAEVAQDEEDGKEFIILDCEDSDHATTQGLVQELFDNNSYDYDLGADNREPDKLYIVADLPDEED